MWVRDVEGHRYFDALSAYSALNFGHRHPRLVEAAREQLERLTLTSRAFHNDQLGPFCSGAGGVHAARPRAADEHRRRGGRDRDQARAQVGLRAQGRRRRPGRDHRLRGQLPRPDDHDRRLLRRPARATASGRSRPASSPCPTATPTRSRAAIGAEHGRLPRRAGPGRGRGRSSRPTATCRGAGDLRRAQTCCSSPTRSSPASAAPAGASPATTRTCVPDLYVLGKALGGGILPLSAVVGRRRRPGRLRARASTAARSAATRSLRRRARGPAPAGRRAADRRVRRAGRSRRRPAARRRPSRRARGAAARPVARNRAGRRRAVGARG